MRANHREDLTRMPTLFGRIGTHAAGPREAVVSGLMAHADWPAAARHELAGKSAAGTGWACIGPCVASDGELAVAVRGRPVIQSPVPGGPAHGLLAAYQAQGLAFLDNLHGSFAFALVDGARRTVILAVDRFGIERLAYSYDRDGLTFGSSAERVARALGSPRIRSQALLDYLFFHMIPSPGTIFEGVRKVAPATAMVLRDQVLTEHVYWRPKFNESSNVDAGELGRTLHASLATGVRAAQPDAQTGAFLSGGLDSSTVAGYLGKVTQRPARTFSMGFGFDDYDELHYARIAAKHFGCHPSEYAVQAHDIVRHFGAIARAYDEPFGNASALPTYCCALFARDNGITHLLAGDGGDEIFAGNKRYAEQLVFERYQAVPRVLRRALLEPALGVIPAPLQVGLLRKGRNYIAQANTRLPDRLESWNFLQRLGYSAILHPELERAVDTNGPIAHMRAVYDSAPGNSAVNKMLYYDWRFTLADNDLRKVGTMCDLAGVQVSFPMLHPDVVDLSNRVPPQLKMRGTELRSFYKEAMVGFLPDEILHKTKHGFGLPFGLWLEQSKPLAELIDANLAGLAQRQLIRPEFMDRLRHLHQQDDARYYGVFVWTFAMLEQWLAEHRLSV